MIRRCPSHTSALVEPLEARRLLADPTLLAWGQDVVQAIDASLKVPGSNLYAERADLDGTRSGGSGGFSYVWPAATMFRALAALVRIDAAAHGPALRAFADELHARYWRNGATPAARGYRSSVSTGADRYYDDNAHLVVSLAEAHRLTGDAVYLTRAVAAYEFVMTGEDSAGGGGIYFRVGDASSKDAISTLQAARAGLLLHRITGEARYLADATRLYAWATGHIQEPDGLFRERFKLTGTNAGQSEGATLINSAGIGLACNILFLEATGDAARLREAQRLARRSLSRYFNAAGAINDEGYWAFELVEALGDLYLADHDPGWLDAATRALAWLRANRQDPNGHYGTLWARETYVPGTVRESWELNDQAAVARSYLYAAAVKTEPLPLIVAAGDPVVGFHGATVGGNGTPSGVGGGPGQYLAGEGPANAFDRRASTKYLNFGSAGPSGPTKGVGTGFRVTPSAGPTIVTGIQVATANDAPNRDPLTVSIEGTNATSGLDTGAAWTLIADHVNLGIGTDPGRLSYGPVVRFANDRAFRSYRVIVRSQRGSDVGVQYAEMNLIGALDPSVMPGDADANGRVDAADYHAIDRGFALKLTGFVHGDFDRSGGAPDPGDYLVIDSAFVRQPVGAAPAAAGTFGSRSIALGNAGDGGGGGGDDDDDGGGVLG